MSELQDLHPGRVAVLRWISSTQNGTIKAIVTPKTDDPGIMAVYLLKKPGEPSSFENADM
jgi:hypothetical protein